MFQTWQREIIKMLTEQQIKNRMTGIGGSDIASIAGLTKRTALDVYFDKKGQSRDFVKTPNQHWGERLENIIINEYAITTGQQCISSNETHRHIKYPWMIAHVDGETIDKFGNLIIIEIKTANQFMSHLWGTPGTFEIPDQYKMQCAHYAIVRDAAYVDIAVLIGGWDFRVYTYDRDKELEQWIIEAEHDFWHSHVLKDIPPPVTTVADCSTLWPRSNGEFKIATKEDEDHISSIYDLKQQMKKIEEEQKKFEMLVKSNLQNYEALKNSQEELLCTWKTNKSGSRVFRLASFIN